MTAAHAAYRAAAPPPPPQPQGRDEVILAELPQVYFVAARIHERLPAGVQIEDLVNAGVVGLIEAYNSFDHTKNAQFRTFARFRIRGAILDSLRVLDWGSRSLRRKAREIADTRQKLEGSLGRRPTNEEVAAEMKLPLEQMEMALTQVDSLQIVNQQAARKCMT
jgi:RNA polymerase sigma factor for flagellar operon FliA